MKKYLKSRKSLAAITAAAVCGGGWWASTVLASDHDEAPLVKVDAAMDLTDLYVFGTAGDTTTIIVCWAGFNDSRPQPDEAALYDDEALYTIWIDNDDDEVADHAIYWRYGQDNLEQWGIRWEGVPGADKELVDGPVEEVFEVGKGARVWTGHAEDPFFFDAGGYLTTLDTGTVSFTIPSTTANDFLAGYNVTAAAIEIDNALIQNAGAPIQVWVTSARLEK